MKLLLKINFKYIHINTMIDYLIVVKSFHLILNMINFIKLFKLIYFQERINFQESKK